MSSANEVKFLFFFSAMYSADLAVLLNSAARHEEVEGMRAPVLRTFT